MFTQLYVKASTLMTDFKNDERGVTAIEYGLIAVAMAVLLGAVFSATGTGSLIGNLEDAFEKIALAISNGTSGS
ncbi:Flp family type IVb pilin [Vibrio sp. E150_011]